MLYLRSPNVVDWAVVVCPRDLCGSLIRIAVYYGSRRRCVHVYIVSVSEEDEKKNNKNIILYRITCVLNDNCASLIAFVGSYRDQYHAQHFLERFCDAGDMSVRTM